jgi:hypothetical protein
MNIYQIGEERDDQGFKCYQSLVLADVVTFRRLEDYRQRNGWFENFQSIRDSWFPVRVVADEDEQDLLLNSDYPYLSVFATIAPVFSQQAVDVLADLLEGNGELLPLVCDFGHYYAFNITREIEALDEDHSEFTPYSELYYNLGSNFDDNSDVPIITRFMFHADRVTDLSIFKLPNRNRYRVPMVTDRFVQRVQEAGLRGFAFKLLWSSSGFSASTVDIFSKQLLKRSTP